MKWVSNASNWDRAQFKARDTRKRGSVEFIRAAMKNMRHFGVHRDLESYRALVDIMPKGKMVAVNLWQKAMWYYPKQQDCIVELMGQMEANHVIPDEGTVLVAHFSGGARVAIQLPTETLF